MEQNKIKVLKHAEVINANLADMENEMGMTGFSTTIDMPRFYWGILFLIKTKKKQMIEEKMQKCAVDYYKNNGWMWISTENKDEYILLLYYRTKRRTRKISTNKLDIYLEYVAADFEYNPREEYIL